MSREIKFRAWDNETNKYFEPTYQSYMGRLEELTIALSGRLQKRTCRGVADESTFHGRYVVEQYTGLKDANGKEIYECDIVHVVTEDGYERTGKVIFEKGCYWVDNGMDKYPVSRIGFKRDTLEILGNAHVNPEIIDFYDMKQL